MKNSFVVVKDGVPVYTAHMAFNDVIEPGFTDENGYTYLEIPEGVSDDVAVNEYAMDPVSGGLVHLGPSPSPLHKKNLVSMSWIYDIDLARVQKQKEIAIARNEAITSGFESNALGEVHTYPCKAQDQANLVASVTDSLNPANGESWMTPFWCADSEGVWDYRLHTKSQIQTAGADGKAHIVAQLTKNAQLQAAINAATTQAELELICW
jgi:hypothetical protein